MTIPTISYLTNTQDSLFPFSEWNGRLEIREMRKDIRDIKDLIVNGNPTEKEDE